MVAACSNHECIVHYLMSSADVVKHHHMFAVLYTVAPHHATTFRGDQLNLHCTFSSLQVANVVGRAESLSCIFFLLSVLSYTHSIGGLRRSPFLPPSHVGWPFTLLGVLFAACAMLSKEQGIMALGVCAAFDVLAHWETVVLG